MDIDEAKTLLDDCDRIELRDHAFGDVEVTWEKEGVIVATGEFSRQHAQVWIAMGEGNPPVTFRGELGRPLRECGTLMTVHRNDETGPDEFKEGEILPGLTKEAVRDEIFGISQEKHGL